MLPDEDAQEPAGRPNPRRESARTPPVIEGAAQEVHDGDGRGLGEAEAPESAAPERPARSPTPVLSLAALAVAILALAGTGALGWRAYSSSDADLQGQALKGQVRTLNDEVAALRSQAAQTQRLDQRIDGVAAAAKAAQAQAKQALAEAGAGRKSIAQGGDADVLAALGKRVGALEGRPDPTIAVQKIESEIAELKKSVAVAQAQTAGVGQRLASLETGQAAQAKSLVPLQALLNAPKIDVDKVEAMTAEAAAQARAAALIVAARALQLQIESGEPFARELAAVERLGGDGAALAPIAADAAHGVATAAQLRKSFQDLEGPILAGVKPGQRGGVLDRLAEEAGRLVRIRAVGAAKGSSPIDVVARIDGALADGDVAASLKDRLALPPAAQALTAAWAAKAQARVTAEAAAQSISARAAENLGKARP